VPALADPSTQFFRTQKEWDQRFNYLGTVDELPSGEQGFLRDVKIKPRIKGPAAPYFEDADLKEDVEGSFVPQAPQPVTISEANLRGAPGTIELEIAQVATIQMRGIRRYASTSQDIVEFYQTGDTLQMKGDKIGSTVVHIWDDAGRISVPVRVIPQRQFQEYARRSIERVEQSESFKLQYDMTRSAFYDGNSYEDLGQTSLSFVQNFSFAGDTPYGHLDGYAQVRDFTDNRDLTTATINLTDGQIGDFKDFNLAMGDTFVTPGLYTLPSARFRGVKVDHAGPDDRTAFTTFFGRELNSILGTLGSIDSQQASIDSFLGGAILDHRLNDHADWRFSYTRAYGQQRADELNNDAFEFVQTYKLNDDWLVGHDIGTDSERIAHKAWTMIDLPHADLRAEYRDVSKDFFAVIGNPSGQGEQGVLLNYVWQPIDPIEIRYDADIWRDRLFPLLGESDKYNVRQDADARWSIDEWSNLRVDFSGDESTALLAPYSDRVYGVSYNRSFQFWNRRMSIFTRAQHQDNENLTNSDASYRRNTLSYGYQTTLFWDILFGFSQSYSNLEEVNTRLMSNPHTTSISFDRDAQIGDTPFYLGLGLRWTDEEDAASLRSFMIGEDRAEVNAELRYELRDMEFYVDGRYTAISDEVRTVEGPRAEAEIITGVRYLWDTGVRWEPSAQFVGLVFNDFNSNGRPDSGEPGIQDAVILVGPHRVVTKQDGTFETPPISGRSATLSLDDNSIPYGFTGTTKLSQDVIIREAKDKILFGLVGKSSVTGVVFNDLNANGVLDSKDTGVEGVRVMLDGRLAKISDRLGRFRFSNIAVGKHQVTMDVRSLPVGYLPQRLYKQDIEVFEGVSYQINLPVAAQRSVSGRAFYDANQNGVFDSSETPLGGARIQLGDRITEADDEGYFLIDNIQSGSYDLTVDPVSVPDYAALGFKRSLVFGNEPSVIQMDISLQRESGGVNEPDF